MSQNKSKYFKFYFRFLIPNKNVKKFILDKLSYPSKSSYTLMIYKKDLLNNSNDLSYDTDTSSEDQN